MITCNASPTADARLLGGGGGTTGVSGLAGHHEQWGPLPGQTGAEVLAAVDASGLRGRGGGAFPTGRKMRSVIASRGRSVVVANGAEGEPASAKDRLLLRHSPHLVLDGIQLAARAVGADQAHLVVHAGTGQARCLWSSIRERRDPVPVQVHELPTAYVASEATAVVHWLNGGQARPTFTPPRSSESGVLGRPTLVNNVETLAHVATIARRGPDWFRSVGDPAQPGTLLLTVSAAGLDRHVIEVPSGTPLGEALAEAGAAAAEAAAILVGGYAGSWLTTERAVGTSLSSAALRAAGGALGAGVVIALPQGHCGVLETARVAAYLAAHSAAQCGPCANGLPAIAGALHRLAVGRWNDRAWPALRDWLSIVPGRGACGLPDGAVAFVRSALDVFAVDVAAHRRGRP
ncbi:MAG TPA: NADH-ubiquinone oxidoreductase-F iron-sulfur binding region domain-containing protein, partial [Marmoricola sp.]